MAREDIEELEGLYSPQAYHAFRDRLFKAAEKYYCPPCPWAAFGIPAICVTFIGCACGPKQKSAIEKVLDDENRRLKDEGLQWNIHGPTNYFTCYHQLALTWLPQIRPHWELANPHLRRVALAPYPYYALDPFVQQDVNSMATNRLSVLGSSGCMNDPLVGTGGKILVNRWHWNESAFDPVKSGYPMGFDMNILTQFKPGQPPYFTQPQGWANYSNQPPPNILPNEEPYRSKKRNNTDVNANMKIPMSVNSMRPNQSHPQPQPQPPSYAATMVMSSNNGHVRFGDTGGDIDGSGDSGTVGDGGIGIGIGVGVSPNVGVDIVRPISDGNYAYHPMTISSSSSPRLVDPVYLQPPPRQQRMEG